MAKTHLDGVTIGTMCVSVTKSCLTLCGPMGCCLSGFSVHGILQQEHWSGLPFPSPEDLPNPGIEPRSPKLQVDSLPYEPPGKPIRTMVIKIIKAEIILFIIGEEWGLDFRGRCTHGKGNDEDEHSKIERLERYR